MPLILDASVTCAWLFADEQTEATDQIARDVANTGAYVPPLWQVEVTNVLLQALKRNRISREQLTATLAVLRRINVIASPYSSDPARLADLGIQYGLTAYDALYLDHALALNADLASLDTDLRKAAEAAGVQVKPCTANACNDF